jgi:DNA-binding PadR family transcriptional regulator
MYEFMILSQLSRRPMHGYMIAKIIGHVMGPFRQVQWGALYPVLNRLVNEGLIQAEEAPDREDERTRKVYCLTEAGRARLHDHLMDVDRHLADYATVFEHKVALFHQLAVEERLFLARHYMVHAQQHIAYLERRLRDLADTPMLAQEQKHDIRTVMAHRLDFWQRERAWAEQLIGENNIGGGARLEHVPTPVASSAQEVI